MMKIVKKVKLSIIIVNDEKEIFPLFVPVCRFVGECSESVSAPVGACARWRAAGV